MTVTDAATADTTRMEPKSGDALRDKLLEEQAEAYPEHSSDSEIERDPAKAPLVKLVRKGQEETERKDELEAARRQEDADRRMIDEYARRKAQPIRDVPHGSWESPLTSDVVTSGVDLQELALDNTPAGKGKLYWMQRQFFDVTSYTPFKKERKEKFDPWHRGTVFEVDCAKPEPEREPVEWTPAPYQVKAVVHGTQLHEFWGVKNYGGSFIVHDGVLFHTTEHNFYRAEQPGFKMNDSLALGPHWFFADADFAYDSLYCVHEKQFSKRTSDKGKQPFNRLLRLHPAHQRVTMENRVRDFIYSDQAIVAEGADFYAHPRVSPDKSKIVWMQWDQPNMPWHATEIWMCDLDTDNGMPIEDSHRKVLGDGKTNYVQPRWHPDGSLYVISDESNWWNVYEVDVAAGSLKRNVHAVSAEVCGAQWLLGSYAHSYDLDPSFPQHNRLAFTVAEELFVKDLASDAPAVKCDTGYTTHRSVYFGQLGDVFAIASSQTKLPVVIRYVIDSGKTEVICESNEELDARVERQCVDWSRYISLPEPVQFATGVDGSDTATGYYYPPKNDDYVAEDELPPLIIHVHDGPTSRVNADLDLNVQFFTSRGFAWFELNYRGSTGFGRQYRDMLNGNWGEMEVDDIFAGYKWLCDNGKCDADAVYLLGESAGGFSVMRAASRDNNWAAAMVQYGFCDLKALHDRANYGHESDKVGMLKDADKFRKCYWQTLTGETDADTGDKLKDLSPVHNADKMACPVGFIYGLEDKMARGTPYDYDNIWKEVKKKGHLTTMLEFYDEGHGPFSKPGNRRLALDGTYAYFVKILGVPQSIKCGHGDGDPYERMFFWNVPGQEDPIDTFLPIGWSTAPKDHC